jgi:hypothetical protein
VSKISKVRGEVNGSKKLGITKTDEEERELCELQEADGESRVAINGGKKSSGGGKPLHCKKKM